MGVENKIAEKERKTLLLLWVTLIFGIMAGSLYGLFCFESLQTRWDGIESYSVEHLDSFSKGELFQAVFKTRGVQFLAFFLCTILFSCSLSSIAVNLIFGFYYGLISCCLLVEYGYDGFYAAYILFFPHSLLYLLAIWWMVIRQKKEIATGNNLMEFRFLLC